MRGRQAVYSLCDFPPETLSLRLPALMAEAGGLNVTIPYKEAVIPFLDKLCGHAERYRAVNTIRICDEGRFGYNTDAKGFLCALRESHIPLKGRVALLGCGGAGRIMACEAALAGCSVVNAVRESSLEKAKSLAAFVKQLAPGVSYEITTLDRLQGDFDLLINATPVGMYPNSEAMPVSEAVLARSAAVFDAVYNPGETMLLRCAKANGARICGGMPMLVWQAAAAQQIWDNTELVPDAVEGLIEESEAEMARRFSV
jgi:shikimate dehydrogenase